jgi:mycothiol synthase
VFVAKRNGKIIGYSSTLPEIEIKRAVLNGLVHPLHRRNGTAGRLLTMSLARAGEWGAETAQVNIPEGNAMARSLLLSRGFGLVRRFLDLEFPLKNLPAPDPGTSTIRGLLCGEEGSLAEVQNRSFQGTWGFNPNTTEEIAYRVHLEGCAPEDVRVTVSQGKVAAYCWTKTRPGENGNPGPRRGLVHMLGVLPEFRGRGLGKRILIAGLRHLMQKGIEVAALTVDSENAAARFLYESMGFRTRSTTAWYRKTLQGR